MDNKKKFYFLPFVDNLTTIGISLLMVLFFGDWFASPVFAAIGTFFMLFTLCGRIYVRMWNLSRKNTRYNYGLVKKDFIRFILPLVIFDLVIIIFYILCEYNIIPLSDVIVSSYYTFPDDSARQFVTVSLFEYVTPWIRMWFTYLAFILKNSFILLSAPILSFASAYLGYLLGKENKQIQNFFVRLSNKIKDKFNE